MKPGVSIGYHDFCPAVLKSGFFSTEHEILAATVERANEWVAACRVRVINVETVVLPNIQDAQGASQVSIRTSGEMSSSDWFQVVRIWFEMPTADTASGV